jgi:DNA-binding LacI/PurR family transcriptional regulator
MGEMTLLSLPINKITIKDIAKMAGVSVATVSRVLNNPEKVQENTRKKIEDIIAENHFVPNQLAKNLFTNTSKSIAIFVYDIENPFFTKLLKEINRIAFDHDYTLIICDTENDEARELKYINYLQGQRVSGIIVTEGSSGKTLDILDQSIPCVNMDRLFDNNSAYCACITSDNFQGAQMAVEYLLRLNHQKIAFVNGPGSISTAKIREKGYIEAMKRNGLAIPEGYIYVSDFNVRGGIKAIEHFMTHREMPTAIFCANDLIAQGIIQRSYTLNLSVPKDFSVVGFDGSLSDTFFPKITTVQQQIDKIAEYVMDTMFKMIDQKPYEMKIIVPTKLVVGSTCIKI